MRLPAVDRVETYAAWSDRLAALLAGGVTASGLLALVVLAAVISVVSSTIRLALQRRRIEVEVLKLVGATDDYVRRPYVVEGAVQGALGATLALVLLGSAVCHRAEPLRRQFCHADRHDALVFALDAGARAGRLRRRAGRARRAAQRAKAAQRMRAIRRTAVLGRALARRQRGGDQCARGRALTGADDQTDPVGSRRARGRSGCHSAISAATPNDGSSELTRQTTAGKAELERLGKETDSAHARTVTRGRVYVRLAKAGLLPVGGGFEALVEHAVQLERLRNAIGRDLKLERELSLRRVALGRQLLDLETRRSTLESEVQAMSAAQSALLSEQDRANAFARAFSGGVGSVAHRRLRRGRRARRFSAGERRLR